MKTPPALRRLLLILPLAAAPLAQAHPGHGIHSFAAGLQHPLSGYDHLLAMVAVGLWAVQLGGRARWALPLMFVSAMVLGAMAGLSGFAVPGVDRWIFASVFALGLLIAGAARLPLGAGLGLVALAGAFHGFAHGAEMPLTANSLHFLAGMVVTTALLHTAGVVLGLAAQKRSETLLRLAGAGIVAGGVALCLA
ncbi:MAG TPA: HupE/UreJ family protein [Opitutaceae bacterium]|jgi:urease accessory protein|nr:HupE/UreJ family protein [Opitutaceae bacterium]